MTGDWRRPPAAINIVAFTGILGVDPDMRKTANKGAVYALISVAQDHPLTGSAMWIKVRAWGKQAAACGKWLSKGDEIFIEGRIIAESWKDSAGKPRTSFYIEPKPMGMKFLQCKKMRTRPDDTKPLEEGPDPYAWES